MTTSQANRCKLSELCPLSSMSGQPPTHGSVYPYTRASVCIRLLLLQRAGNSPTLGIKSTSLILFREPSNLHTIPKLCAAPDPEPCGLSSRHLVWNDSMHRERSAPRPKESTLHSYRFRALGLQSFASGFRALECFVRILQLCFGF